MKFYKRPKLYNITELLSGRVKKQVVLDVGLFDFLLMGGKGFTQLTSRFVDQIVDQAGKGCGVSQKRKFAGKGPPGRVGKKE